MRRIDASRRRPPMVGVISEHTGRLAIALVFTSMLLGPSTAAPPDNRSIEAWQAEWTRVLQRHVDAEGKVDFSGLANDRCGLEDLVKFVAAVDPSPRRHSFLPQRLNSPITSTPTTRLQCMACSTPACPSGSAGSAGSGSSISESSSSAGGRPRSTALKMTSSGRWQTRACTSHSTA